MSLRRLLSTRSASSRRLDKLQDGCSLGTLMEEARKVAQLTTIPKKLVQLWVCLVRWLNSTQTDVVETVSRALLNLLVVSEYSTTPGFKCEVRKVLEHKSAPLDLKLKVLCIQVIEFLTGDLYQYDRAVVCFLRHSCLDYCTEGLFLNFLIKVTTYAADLLCEFDFPEVLLVVCKHCVAAAQVPRKQRHYSQLALQLLLKLAKASWSLHYETKELFMLLCCCYTAAESSNIITVLMSRNNSLFYVNILVDLLRFDWELGEVRLGAAYHLMETAWIRPIAMCNLPDLLLLQTLHSVKSDLKPLFPTLISALSMLISRKFFCLRSEWMYILGLLLEVWERTRDSAVKTLLQGIGPDYQGDEAMLSDIRAAVS